MSKRFDTHAHLSSQEIVALLPSPNYFLNVTSQPSEWLESIFFSSQYNNVLNALGIHPWFVDEKSEVYFKQLEWLLQNETISAIGEIGLDYANTNEVNRLIQRKVFHSQIVLASQYQLPVSLHCYKAFDDLYNIVNKAKVIGVLHGFNQSYELAMQFVKIGFKIGVGGSILSDKTKLNKTVFKLPIECLVLETDFPNFKHDGQSLALEQSVKIIDKIAQIKSLPVSTVEEYLYNNAMQIFKKESD